MLASSIVDDSAINLYLPHIILQPKFEKQP